MGTEKEKKQIPTPGTPGTWDCTGKMNPCNIQLSKSEGPNFERSYNKWGLTHGNLIKFFV